MAEVRRVQRRIGVALWRQIADRVRDAIGRSVDNEVGIAPPKMTSAEQFYVNRHTLRNDLTALDQEGIVRTPQGRSRLTGLVGSRRRLVAASVVLSAMALPLQAAAQEPNFRIGSSVISELKYKPGFKHFDYVNPDAPKGGNLRLSA
ncbi:hypothetical protein B5K06_33405, partial [Rhizobium grahamii]